MSATLNRSNTDPNVPFASPLEWSEHLFDLRKKMAFLAFSHTAVEHRLYEAMLAEVTASGLSIGVFGVRRLVNLTGLSSNSSVRRGCLGLVKKLSVEPAFNVSSQHKSLYHIYSPEEIFRRRQSAGFEPFPRDFVRYQDSQMMGLVIEHVLNCNMLSRRQAFVTLHCAEGLSNAEIGKSMRISEQTVKYHLRRIFLKLGVKRRTELVKTLLSNNAQGRSAPLIFEERAR